MMPLADYHVHTSFCDGENTPEELVLAALSKGMTALGFSGHSHMAFDGDWNMNAETAAQYRAEIARLKEKYAGQIEILCGVEQDIFSDAPTEGYDYVIGSVHYVKTGGKYVAVDLSREDFRRGAETYFGGDCYAFAEAYFDTVARVADVTGCGIIGHFDLFAKFNGGGDLFDESHPRYVTAWQKAADALLKSGKVFEVNTGAIARGYRVEPYPAAPIFRYLRERGARFLLSSDAHSADTLCFAFEKWAQLYGLC